MGCDIHCYVEYRRTDEDGGWWSFGGRINPGRNYSTFSNLAGVRGSLPKTGVEPRGIPEDLGSHSWSDWWLWITDEVKDFTGRIASTVDALMLACLANPDDGAARAALCDELQASVEGGGRRRHHCPGACTPEQAEKYAKYGSEYLFRDGKRVAVQHPDWHTPSWLTPAEWERMTRAAGPEYQAMTAAMRSLEKTGHVVRVVFWFDN